MTGVFRAVDLSIDRTGCGGVLKSNIFTKVYCGMYILIRYNQQASHESVSKSLKQVMTQGNRPTKGYMTDGQFYSRMTTGQ